MPDYTSNSREFQGGLHINFEVELKSARHLEKHKTNVTYEWACLGTLREDSVIYG
ncbi:hypothetical protein LguiA_003225 [Lonicera macranthoides]